MKKSISVLALVIMFTFAAPIIAHCKLYKVTCGNGSVHSFVADSQEEIDTWVQILCHPEEL